MIIFSSRVNCDRSDRLSRGKVFFFHGIFVLCLSVRYFYRTFVFTVKCKYYVNFPALVRPGRLRSARAVLDREHLLSAG